MRIGLDLDGVMFDFVGVMRRTFPSIPKDPEKVDLTQYLNPRDQEIFYRLLNSPEMFGNLPLIPGMEKLVPYFNAQDTWVITSRNRNVHDATRRQLQHIGLKPIEILFRRNKTKTIRDYNIDVLIEDQVKNAEPVSKDRVVLMPNYAYNREWVKKEQDEDRMVFNYNNPDELRDFLKKLEGVTHGVQKHRSTP
jgi:uncharacterized HAD superfamily protein